MLHSLQRLGGTTVMDWDTAGFHVGSIDSLCFALAAFFIRIVSSRLCICKGSMPAHPNYCRDASLDAAAFAFGIVYSPLS